MKLELQDSSCIAAWGYDEVSCDLVVVFHSGSTYRYLGVPFAVWEELQQHPSKGQIYNKLVKNTYSALKET